MESPIIETDYTLLTCDIEEFKKKVGKEKNIYINTSNSSFRILDEHYIDKLFEKMNTVKDFDEKLEYLFTHVYEKDELIEGDTFLHTAILTMKSSIAKKLIALGANIEAQSDANETPIMACISPDLYAFYKEEQIEEVRMIFSLLIEAGASLSVPSGSQYRNVVDMIQKYERKDLLSILLHKKETFTEQQKKEWKMYRIHAIL